MGDLEGENVPVLMMSGLCAAPHVWSRSPPGLSDVAISARDHSLGLGAGFVE